MACVMGTCGGLVGPKTEHVEKVKVFKAFLKGQHTGGHDFAILGGGGCFEVDKVSFLI